MIPSATELGTSGLLDLTVLTSPGDAVGPGPRFSRPLAPRKITELLFACWSRDGRSAEMALLAARCPLLDGRLRSSRQDCGPKSGMPSALRVSRILTPILRDFSRRDPEASCHLYSTRRLCYGPHCLQLSGYRFSQSRDPCAQILEPFLARPRYAIPRADPTVLLDPDPTVIHLLASRVLAT
jgi:hypothetical protein